MAPGVPIVHEAGASCADLAQLVGIARPHYADQLVECPIEDRVLAVHEAEIFELRDVVTHERRAARRYLEVLDHRFHARGDAK
jgi:hypothetical protein